jgi:hypothetical protein
MILSTSCSHVLQAYVDLVRAWGWRSFTIIYENNEGLVRLQELLKAHGPSEFPIAVRQLGEGTDYRYVTPNCSIQSSVYR